MFKIFKIIFGKNKSDMDAQELLRVRSTSEQDKMLLVEKKYFQKLLKIQSSLYFASILFNHQK